MSWRGVPEDGNRIPQSVVDPETGCWIWTRSVNLHGYGREWKRDFERGRVAHVVAWETLTGERVPKGYELDHLCRTRRCRNPAHLELVTRRENNYRRNKANGWLRRK